MSISAYQASVPVFRQLLGSLSAILDKAAEHCRNTGTSEASLIEARLAPDMFAFARQVQIATDHAKGATARLSGREIPKFEDTEKSFAELKARIDKTLAFIAGVQPSEMDGAEEREVTLTIGGEPRTFTGRRYLFHFALPNFFFHTTTAYDILRHKGVPLGKRDFIGAPPKD